MKRPFIITLLFASVAMGAKSQPKGLRVGDQAPHFSGKDQTGKKINLSNELAKNKVVLIFYRGEWCPFCNRELKAVEDSLQYIRAKGATVVAVSPEKAENIDKTIQKTKASYSILHDQNLTIMKSYDVAFEVDTMTIRNYKKYGLDFNSMNGENGSNLPVPAIYIIDKKGKITYRYFDADYRRRPSVKELLSHL